TPSPRAPRRTLLAGLAAVVVVSALLGTALVVALISQRDEPSVARSSSAPVAVAAPAPLASPAATTPVVPAPATPASPLPSPVVAPARPAVPTAPGLERHPERGELRCSTGVHDLSGVVLDDLPLRIVLFVMGDCQLTCTACTFVGSGPVVLLSERGRLTLVRSTVTARDGAALYVGSEARATVVDSRLTGRLPTDVQGTLTTRGSSYASGVQRAAGARVIDEGGNTGLRR
ncbi:MAG: hypothetical protein IT379_03370, partial [Deltaproteobacteria bacterium]|nr:hypothetical protein [Deltaproteobacteria bacterium]